MKKQDLKIGQCGLNKYWI